MLVCAVKAQFYRTLLGAVVFGTLYFFSPPERPVDRQGKIDCIGSALGTGALIIFNFVWKCAYREFASVCKAHANLNSQAPSAGWAEPYEIALLLVSIVLWIAFIIWERRYASEPIMPLDIFKAPSFAPLVLVVLLSYMSFGTLLWYMVAWQQLLRSYSILSFAVGWTPFAIFATLSAPLAAFLIPRLAAQWILAIGAISVLTGNLLLATMPAQQSYWAQMFPASVLMSFCPDFVYAAAQIVASNSFSRKQQGIAGSLIGTLNLYGNSLGLGFAGTVEKQASQDGLQPVKGYKAALFFGVGLATAALVCDLLFVRMAKDEREGWDREADLDTTDEAGEATGVETVWELQSVLTRPQR